MARIKEIEERLKRWQTWYFTVAQAGTVKSPRLGVKVDGVPVAMAPIAAGTEEALETDRAVAKLPSDLKAIIKVVYLDPEGRTMEDNARILHMNRRTLYRKLELSDRYLVDELYNKSELVDCHKSELL
jgi:DNA-binding NtrC family response regulator|nr:MAG TPA: antitermination protein Q [Caudoviricetes sp.]